MKGQVRADWEIGGETTGFVLNVQKASASAPTAVLGKLELAFRNAEQKRQALAAIKERSPVVISGDLRTVKGQDVEQRHIIDVATLRIEKQ